MSRRGAAAIVLGTAVMLAGCGRAPDPARRATPGDRLETAATAAGLVADPARADPVGLYATGGDRVCVVPRSGGGYGLGVLIQYDDAQGCTARGVAARDGDRLRVGLVDDAHDDCRFDARFEGDRIVFPAALPAACDRRCAGRASLSALAVDRLSEGVAEAAAARDGRGRPLCGG